MKRLLIVVFALLVSACGKPASIESAESLVANPARLKALRGQCQADHARVGDAQCSAVAEATRLRFMGSGTPYTPATSLKAPKAPKNGSP
ncbi:MAG: EexN family lipoprotein [Devosia sp.]